MNPVTANVPRIHSLPDDSAWVGGLPPVGSPEHPWLIRVLDRILATQRPAVIAHLRAIRSRHPDASPSDVCRILERRYLAAVTTGGAAVGATAVVPGVGTAVTLALAGAETVGFLEATALFAQSLAEVHGIRLSDPDRARALVLTLMVGREGVDLVNQFAGQVSGAGKPRQAYWGELVTTSLPRAMVGPLVDRLKSAFLRRVTVQGGVSAVGRALPFGVGAVVGGSGNHILGRRVIVGARRAFGVAPLRFPADLAVEPATPRKPLRRRGRRVRGGHDDQISG